MTKENIVGLGEFEFFRGYFIGRINEGSVAGSDFVDELSKLIQKYYQGQQIIYISDRVNSYSLDPVATMSLLLVIISAMQESLLIPKNKRECFLMRSA